MPALTWNENADHVPKLDTPHICALLSLPLFCIFFSFPLFFFNSQPLVRNPSESSGRNQERTAPTLVGMTPARSIVECGPPLFDHCLPRIFILIPAINWPGLGWLRRYKDREDPAARFRTTAHIGRRWPVVHQTASSPYTFRAFLLKQLQVSHQQNMVTAIKGKHIRANKSNPFRLKFME